MATEYKLSYTASEIDAKLGKIDGLVEKTSIVQVSGDSETAVMSQKAVTDAISQAVSNVMPEFVDSVDQMTDTAKKYVLTTTGTVWQYDNTMKETEVSTEIVDEIIGTDDNPYQTGRLSSGGALSSDVSTHTLTPYIDLTKSEYQGKTIQIHLEGNRYATETDETYIMSAIFDTSKNTIAGRAYTDLTKANFLGYFDNAGMTLEIHGNTSATLTFPVPLVEDGGKTVGYFRFCGLGTVKDSVYITYMETEIVTSIVGWADTGIAFSGGGSGGGSSADVDVTEIAEQAAALVDTNLLTIVGNGEVSV